jgi:HEAT repeat protein
MKRRFFSVFTVLAVVLMFGLVGCSRTVDDVAKWKAKGKISKLIGALKDPKQEVRLASAEALGELKAESAVDPLASLFDDPETEVMLAAVNALVSIGTEPAASHLMLALRLENTEARLIAAVALGELKSVKSVSELAKALDDSDAGVALAAATSLGQIGEAAGSKALVGKLGDSSTELRLVCVESLGKTGGEDAAEGLIGALADKDSGVRKAAGESLVAIGEVTVPYALEALRNDNELIRGGSIAALKALDGVPTTGNDLIWFMLAQVSTDGKSTIDYVAVRKLAKMDADAVETLLQAVAHNVSDVREHAFRALELIGESCTDNALAAADDEAGSSAKDWLEGRSAWDGAPNWRIGLWAALTALNPDFEYDSSVVTAMQTEGRTAFRVIISPKFTASREYTPLLINLLGDRTIPPPEQPELDKDGIPTVKQARDTFRGEANQQIAREKLIAAGDAVVLPLIAAVNDNDDALIAGHIATALGEIGDARAVDPLIQALTAKVDAEEELSQSPFYNALQKLDDPKSEPILLKVRPNSDRAMRVFERKYSEVKVLSAESRDDDLNYANPITFRLGYIVGPSLIETPVTFSKDDSGDWVPSPALPEELPKQKNSTI